MDLGFARRQRGQKIGMLASPKLARLLAEVSARQAVTPTAKAQMQDRPPENSVFTGHPEIAQFAPKDATEIAASKVASFNIEVAEAILTQSKSS
jgi:soluble lytic murein transglycosylase-like protein